MECKQQCQNKFNSLMSMDLFGQMPTFQILGKSRHSTPVGFWCTCLIIFLSLYYLLQGILDIQNKEYPIIIQTDSQVIETSVFQLLSTNFTIAVSAADHNQKPLQNMSKYFTLTIQNCHYHRQKTSDGKVNLTQNCIPYPVEACTAENFNTDTQKSFFSNIRLGTVQCIQQSTLNNNPPTLQGLKSSIDYSFLQITLSLCQNTTTFNTCASLDNIKTQLQTGYYVVYLSDSLLQMSNVGDVAQEIIQMEYTTFSFGTSKQLFQGFKIIETLTEDGVLFTHLDQNVDLIQNSYRESTDLYNSQYLIQHNIFIDNKYSTYYRKYKTIISVLSNVGGLYQIMFVLIGLITKPIINLLMQLAMCNELFRFQNDDKNQQKKQLLPTSHQIVQDLRQIEFSNKNHLAQRIINYWDKKHFKIKESLGMAFSILCGCNKKKKQLIQQAQQEYMIKIDVANILNTLFEIDKLKCILLTKEQRTLFECLPKPLIKNVGSDLELSVIQQSYTQKLTYKESPVQYINEMLDSFIQIMNNKQKSKIDQAILNSLDEDVKTLLSQLRIEKLQEKITDVDKDKEQDREQDKDKGLSEFLQSNSQSININDYGIKDELNYSEVSSLPAVGATSRRTTKKEKIRLSIK